jgi:hypothetical protein
MIKGRRVLPSLIAGLVLTAVASADMVPQAAGDLGVLCASTDLYQAEAPTVESGFRSVADPGAWAVPLLPHAPSDARQNPEVQAPRLLTDGVDSLSLCLSGLMGLGLWASAHWVKRLSFGFIPEWYHNGGPFQIGHSLAVSPESLCPVPVYCFVQPVCTAENAIAQYRVGMVLSLWRKSQCTPRVLGSRAPPDMS